jgi:colanic acid/amylovoran biosynthesis protein
MNILIIGQCTLHWGRMEFGNIGNFYIMEPFFRELHRSFPNAVIRTTMQMSDRFRIEEKVEQLPLELYYAWRDNELNLAQQEVELSEKIKSTGTSEETTDYIEAVKWADLVIDFSGDIWGDNANFLGKDRFKVGLMKNTVAQNLGKPTALLAGSPGPFSDTETKALAQKVFSQFDLVTNREPISSKLLDELDFDTSKTVSLACPAFLFEPASTAKMKDLLEGDGLCREQRGRPVVGFIVCGWNFENGPFDLWPRDDSDYEKFAESIELISEKLGCRVCLMSHSNGFDIPPAPFELKHGRDYPISKQLQSVIERRGIAKNVVCLDGVYDAWQTKAIIGSFDMLVSGRVHAAVAGLSQSVPTVIIDYGHEPKAHKLRGFATVAGVTEYVADPSDGKDLDVKIEACWSKRDEIKSFLDEHIPEVCALARENFQRLRDVI